MRTSLLCQRMCSTQSRRQQRLLEHLVRLG